ncbi:GNAT family N-acetyltransferase [Colwellia sp. M166]|uniref:GNAT family N-acetyltransferase n=1 Tax=Colwellia sp. M166 TaxID=2583805 RepID=UPI00211E4E7B|nr:GNAT family N-acetyltransferase [Colwellia sp. M166]UUO22508.1 GNAT family N-acetyltransferase [Colwellia sp. M166]|tara:strand:+ start:16747 stop:17277 length:531 start_codon:yes stop_codon:yes gene_type:complete
MTISKIEKHLPTQISTYLVIKAKKSDKKDIQRFYKTQRYAAGFIGHDHAYFIKHNTEIIACVIISAGQESGLFWLLHGLVIDSEHRGSGIASLLLRTVIAEQVFKEENKQVRYDNIICFADQALATLYLSNKFVSHNTAKDIAQLPDEFRQRFLRYRENHKNLCCYFYNANFPYCA